MAASTTTAMIRDVVDVLTLPTQTQNALSTPVCDCDTSRAWYTKRQMMPAPMNEIAIGRKINDLAAFSPFARSASTATARPIVVASVTTTTTHHRLLNTMPRIAESTPIAKTKNPTKIRPNDPGPVLYFCFVARP